MIKKLKDFNYNGKDYHICISKAVAFPQDYAAMMTMAAEVSKIPKAVGIDIGGFTTDYFLMRHGELDMDYCDSMEKGVITMYNQINSNINSEYDMLLEESDIDSIRERGIDTKSAYAIFIGGGAMLLKKFIEKADRLGKYMFIEDLRQMRRDMKSYIRCMRMGSDAHGKKEPIQIQHWI